jgi:hypothetical protein
MFDVFYSGTKPNQFAHEREADSIEQAQSMCRTRYFWWITYLADYSTFDFLWEPVPWQSEYTHAWPTQWDQLYGIYLVPKQGEIKYHYHSEVLVTRQYPENYLMLADADFDTTWVPPPWNPPYIYVFGNQWWPAEKMPSVEYRVPGATERKYMRWPRASLLPDTAKWTVPDSVDPNSVDYSWVPDPGDPPYHYQFATQHQKTGGPVYSVPGATETKYLAELKIQTAGRATAVIEIDHLDGNAGNIPNTTRRVRYFDNYRDTLVRVAKSLVDEHEYVWICSSICDYTNFDFTWHPEDWQATMLHVFASNEQKFGDTFFMHVPTFAEYGDKKALLEWYDVNFVDVGVPRRPMPVIQHTEDSHVDAVKNATWSGPLATFTTADAVPSNVFTVPLWRAETKTIVPLSKGAASVIVPRTAVGGICTQLYDYPYINKTQRFLKEQPLDIVFISNGEKYAGFHEQQLYQAVQREGLDCNHIHHSAGVNGRVAAYQAAARMSTTPWFFAVFAKLEVDPKFDWAWQPDRMQQPKHYIFHAYNPVNGLTYGHQAMIAYNKRMVLENAGTGLDFTLDQPHEVVPVLSGRANYTESPWMAWRTAFREVLKLKASLPDVESEYRLRQWLEVDTTNEQWSMKGAEDAVEYYDEVAGDFTALKKSYEWEWLATYAFIQRSLQPDR